MIILWVRREEGDSLYEADSEQHHLVPCQSLAHTLSLTHTKGNQGWVFLVPEREINFKTNLAHQNSRCNLPSILSNEPLRTEGSRILEGVRVSHDELQVGHEG